MNTLVISKLFKNTKLIYFLMIIEKKSVLVLLSFVLIFALIFSKSYSTEGYAILDKCFDKCDKSLNTCKPLVESSFVLCRNSADINYKSCRENAYNTCANLPFDTCLKPRLESCFNEWKRELKQCESNAEIGLRSCSDNLIDCAEKC